MKIIAIAVKDWLQILRDRKSLFFLVVMPVVLTFVMGLALRQPEAGDARLPVALVNADTSALTAGLPALVEASGVLRVESRPVDGAEQALADLRAKKVVAVVVVPQGFGERTLAGEQVGLAVTLDETSNAGQIARTALQTALSRLLGAAEMARLRTEAAAQANPGLGAAGLTQARDAALASALQAWLRPPLTSTLAKATGVPTVGAAWGYNQSSPGMMVMFSLFSLTLSATVLALERTSGTLSRLLTTATRRAEVVAGHTLAMFGVVAGQGLILVGAGQVGFGVNYFRDPLATVLVVGALALWVACLGLLVGSLARGQEQVSLWALVCMFILSAMGGAWFSLEGVGSTFSTIGHLMPSAWAMDGLQSIVLRGLSVDAVLLPVGVMLAYAAAFFTLAIWRFRAAE